MVCGNEPRRRDADDGQRLIGHKAHIDWNVTEARVGAAGNPQLVVTAFRHAAVVNGHVLTTMGFQELGKQLTKRPLLPSPFVLGVGR